MDDHNNVIIFQNSHESPTNKGQSSSTFLNVDGHLLLDSPATGPWMVVTDVG